jgi:hypothetical protein
LTAPGVLALAANTHTRRDLADRIDRATEGRHPVVVATPMGFIQSEVRLFYPLLVERLGLPGRFPMILRSENEQELAGQLWRQQAEQSPPTSAVAVPVLADAIAPDLAIPLNRDPAFPSGPTLNPHPDPNSPNPNSPNPNSPNPNSPNPDRPQLSLDRDNHKTLADWLPPPDLLNPPLPPTRPLPAPETPSDREWERLTRRALDLLQLAALNGLEITEIPERLQAAGLSLAGWSPQDWGDLEPAAPGADGTLQGNAAPPEPPAHWLDIHLGTALTQWRDWCLERGFLTYGLMGDLYWRCLLPDPDYRDRLRQRFQGILADDVDDYPAILCALCAELLDHGAIGAFSFNPDGSTRLGLGADPDDWLKLKERCTPERHDPQPDQPHLGRQLGPAILAGLGDTTQWIELAQTAAVPLRSLQTVARSQLLRTVGDTIVAAVQSGQAQPGDIAVIGPGIDAIGRYTLHRILTEHQIPVDVLDEQRSLVANAEVRALLTLMAFVYPGLGRLIDRDAVAEMLTIFGTGTLPTRPGVDFPAPELGRKPGSNLDGWELPSSSRLLPAAIDPVRAGLIVDGCYAPHPTHPHLKPATALPRWDRLGYRATAAYERLLAWIADQQAQYAQRAIASPVTFLDRAIQQFLWQGGRLNADRLTPLRELVEAAQRYWDIAARLTRISPPGDGELLRRFITLLYRGTITANPYPVRPAIARPNAVTLAAIFQYRARHAFHRWQFWLDVGSPLWLQGGSADLFGADCLRVSGNREVLGPMTGAIAPPATAPLPIPPEMTAIEMAAIEMTAPEITTPRTHLLDPPPLTWEDYQRLMRILSDLLGRAGDRIYLCHSDLSIDGREQTGPLQPLAAACLAAGS